MRNLCQELDFVGKIKKIEWFNAQLSTNDWFVGLVMEVCKKRPDTTIRNILYSFFPIAEYLNHKHEMGVEVFFSFQSWESVVRQKEELFILLVAKHGTQGNIPQRAAMVLDFLTGESLLEEENVVVEIGCSAGLVGSVFENHTKLFLDESFERYFWLKKRPLIPIGAKFSYIGYDLMPPPKELVPFFIWDKDKREKVKNFLHDYPPGEEVVQKSAADFLLEELSFLANVDACNVIILTSFVLYQFDDPQEIQDLILQAVRKNIHWVDLSRNNDLPGLFMDQEQLRSNWIYLSHNGKQVAEVVDGSDDCPNWRYL